jgi:hypothetical protein
MPIILTPSVAPTLPTTTFASMVPEISAMLPGCPSLVIERTARKMAVDLSQRGRVWVLDMLPFALVTGTYEYPLVPTVSYAEPLDIFDAYLIAADGSKTPLPWKSYKAVRAAHPEWPGNDTGRPRYVTTNMTGYVSTVPVPDVAGDVYVRAYVRPIAAAAEIPTWLYNEFQRQLFHGVIHELMAMPDRPWSNAKVAEYHGRQWTYLLSQATIRAGQEYNTDSQAVQMRPFA